MNSPRPTCSGLGEPAVRPDAYLAPISTARRRARHFGDRRLPAAINDVLDQGTVDRVSDVAGVPINVATGAQVRSDQLALFEERPEVVGGAVAEARDLRLTQPFWSVCPAGRAATAFQLGPLLEARLPAAPATEVGDAAVAVTGELDDAPRRAVAPATGVGRVDPQQRREVQRRDPANAEE